MSAIIKNCAQCKDKLTCNQQDITACWCHDLPNILPMDVAGACMCRTCLTQAIAAQVQTMIQSQDLKTILKIAKPYFNAENLFEHIDYTIEQGNYVFSTWYHLKRGKCCGNGCKNCPYTP